MCLKFCKYFPFNICITINTLTSIIFYCKYEGIQDFWNVKISETQFLSVENSFQKWEVNIMKNANTFKNLHLVVLGIFLKVGYTIQKENMFHQIFM